MKMEDCCGVTAEGLFTSVTSVSSALLSDFGFLSANKAAESVKNNPVYKVIKIFPFLINCC